MKYDFDEIVPRRGTNAIKWDMDTDPEVLPMWVADMDFRTAPAVAAALQRRVQHDIFGYATAPKAYYDAITGWFRRRHGWQIRPEWVLHTTGVIPALSAVIKALTQPGDKVLIQTPVYNHFFTSIHNSGCQAAESPLVYRDNTYTIDFDDLERKAADPAVKLMLLCNPHNPAGRVWTPAELHRIGELCLRHDVVVVADEIHCELVFSGHSYTPFASLSEDFLHHSVTCISPSKAFNIAGLQIANIVSADAGRRARIDRAVNDNEVCDVNPFGVLATRAAYNEGAEWLDELIGYLHANYRCMRDFCREHLPDFPITELEGTYLVWMDCRRLGIPSHEMEQRLIAEARLWLNAGTMYGAEGEGFMRWNIACPRVLLMDGLNRFLGFVKTVRAGASAPQSPAGAERNGGR